jgi:hypothetical protein
VTDPEKRSVAIHLAKAHLDTVMTDYVIFGFDRAKDPIYLQEEINVMTVEALGQLYELTLKRLEELANVR